MALGVALVNQDLISPLQLATSISQKPAQIAGIQKQWQEVAGWVLIDPSLEWTVNNDEFASQGKNTPFLAAKVIGRTIHTFFKE